MKALAVTVTAASLCNLLGFLCNLFLNDLLLSYFHCCLLFDSLSSSGDGYPYLGEISNLRCRSEGQTYECCGLRFDRPGSLTNVCRTGPCSKTLFGTGEGGYVFLRRHNVEKGSVGSLRPPKIDADDDAPGFAV